MVGVGEILRKRGIVRVQPWLPPNCLEALILEKMVGVGEILRKRKHGEGSAMAPTELS